MFIFLAFYHEWTRKQKKGSHGVIKILPRSAYICTGLFMSASLNIYLIMFIIYLSIYLSLLAGTVFLQRNKNPTERVL